MLSLSELLNRLATNAPSLRLHASPDFDAESCRIEELIFDSRSARPQTLFFALPGTHVDGHDFLAEVVSAGCRALVVSRLPSALDERVCYVVVDDTRRALSPFSAAFYDHPSRTIPVVGVTGTDGKSSTVSYIHQLFELSGHAAGFFSTVQWKAADVVERNTTRQSTPEAPQIHALLRRMVDHGKRFAVLESTSHGLSPKTNRLGDVRYFAAVFTNVTTEHLEFHGTVEAYRRDKARLFEAIARSDERAFAVVNLDDPHCRLFIDAAKGRDVLTYSTRDPSADLFARSIDETAGGLSIDLVSGRRSERVAFSVPGRFNAENLMAALLTVSQALTRTGTPTTVFELLAFVPRVEAVKGRMRTVDAGQPFCVVVDYAHTPGAFEKLLPSVRSTTPGKLVVVFGSGGERDRDKRPLQGRLADRWADVVVLTDEDPRLEDPMTIIEDIARGIEGKTLGSTLFKIEGRAQAVAHAVSIAREGDTVLLLGKGHEQTLVTSAGSLPYDEETVVRNALAALGWKS